MAISLQQPVTKRQRRVLPGFGLTMGITIVYLCLLVLIPLSMLFVKTSALPQGQFWEIAKDPRVVAAFRVTFGCSFWAAIVDVFAGLLVAWVLVRYRFFGKRLIDGLIDLPFALPTAVAGISLTTLYVPNGWIGHFLLPHHFHFVFAFHFKFVHFHREISLFFHGLKVAFTPLGITIALIFIGFPFVVRTVQPVLEDIDTEVEEAAASLGASRAQTFLRVILPTIAPAALTGFTLAFARALGEYGSVVFISGNMPMKTEIIPLLIISKLEEYNYPGATAIAIMMLLASFTLIFLINMLQWWGRKRQGAV